MKEIKNITITSESLAKGFAKSPIANTLNVSSEGRMALVINPVMDYLADNADEEQTFIKIKRAFISLITNPRRKFSDTSFETGAIMRPSNVITERTVKLGSIIDSVVAEIRKEYPEVC